MRLTFLTTFKMYNIVLLTVSTTYSSSSPFLSQPCKTGQTRTLTEVAEPAGAPQESTGTPRLLAPRPLPLNHSGAWQAIPSFGRKSSVPPGSHPKSPKFNAAIRFSLLGSRVWKQLSGLFPRRCRAGCPLLSRESVILPHKGAHTHAHCAPAV